VHCLDAGIERRKFCFELTGAVPLAPPASLKRLYQPITPPRNDPGRLGGPNISPPDKTFRIKPVSDPPSKFLSPKL
jgi:hypothetical protein